MQQAQKRGGKNPESGQRIARESAAPAFICGAQRSRRRKIAISTEGKFLDLRKSQCRHLSAQGNKSRETMMAKNGKPHEQQTRRLRSQLWFDNPDNPGMTALYLERYLNYGLTRGELTSGKPIIGIAQTGSDLSPCNRHHLQLAERVREGIRTAGGLAMEFPVHPIQETGKRPTAALDRNLAYLGLVEVLFGYPLDGVVLMTGCDKTTPACLMAAAT